MRGDLRRHLQRTGNVESMLTDATTKYSMEFASNVLDLVEAALQDQGVSPYATRQILDKVIFGVVPNSADINLRQELMTRLTEAESRKIGMALQLNTPEEVDAAMRRLQGVPPKTEGQ